MTQIRVVVVDDSPTMRALLRAALHRDGDVRVVAEAADPYEAREAIKRHSPDVITLDVNMPRMSGLEFLGKIMRLRPTPVIMVSSEVGDGAAATIEALAMGAFDCVEKQPAASAGDPFADLAQKVRAAAQARVRSLPRAEAAKATGTAGFRPDGRIVAIGASTGGVDALLRVVSAFPANCPPTLIAQHMPATFTPSFARRLNEACAAEVSEAWDGAPIEPGRVYLAPGGAQHLEVAGKARAVCRLREGPLESGHRPSVDVLFRSLARRGGKAVGVLLTGMGRDGAQGLLALRNAGALTLGQDAATSLVYGMPRVAAEIGAVGEQFAIDAIGEAIVARCDASRRIAS